VLHHPENREYRSGLAKGLLLLGGNFMSRSLMDKAEAVAQRGRDLLQGLHAQAPEDETTRESLARCEWNLGRVFEETTRRPEAEQAYRRAADHLDALLADDPTDPDHRSLLAAILNDLASVRRGDEAIATYRRAEALIESLVNEFPDRPEHRGRLLKCLTGLTQTHGRYEEIEDASRRGVELAERFVKDDPGSHSYRSALSSFLSMLGQSIRYKQPEQAREHLKRAYDLGQELVTDFPDVANHRYNLALVCTQIAGNSVVGPPDDPHYSPALGLERARQAVELLAEERFPRAPLGWALYRSGDWRGCIEALEGVLKDYDDHFLAMAYWRLGDKARSRHEFERADASLPELVKSWVPGEFPDPTFRRRIRAEAAALLGLDAATRGEDGVTPPEGGAGSK